LSKYGKLPERKEKGHKLKKLELTADQLNVIIKALDKLEPIYIKNWELDTIPAGEHKDDYINDLIDELEKALI
jgi:hypothetical protein